MPSTPGLDPHSTLRNSLEILVTEVLADLTGLSSTEIAPLIAIPKNSKLGDYQSNAVMGLAKRLDRPSRELAQEVAAILPKHRLYSTLVDRVEVAGPGFINIHLQDSALIEFLLSQKLSSHRKLDPGTSETVVVDYSSPNIAKEMHVGHIRSTILGDAIVRILEFLGHRVVPQNHLGDWGTQFGMLIAFYREQPERLAPGGSLRDIEGVYREAHQKFQDDSDFQARAKAAVVGLHRGQTEDLALWGQIIEASRQHLHENYEKLGVRLSPEADRGESFYNPLLEQTVQDLKARLEEFASTQASLRIDDGAVCVYLCNDQGEPLHRNQEGEPLPFLVQKSDGAFLYATTDLAALRFRATELDADRTIYVTDSRQALHFDLLFAAAKAAGFTDRGPGKSPMVLEHVTFGTVLGPDRKPLKTRDGQNIKLSALLTEAVERAEKLVPERALDGTLSKTEIATKIGIGALKYADLSQNRQTDYVFSWDKLLAMEGNTAPYLMYAYARIASILREAGPNELENSTIVLSAGEERSLVSTLVRFPEAVESAAADWRVNLLTDYLYQLASSFMKFYESCPVLKVSSSELRASRIVLCRKTQEVLQAGLNLLGITTVERM